MSGMIEDGIYRIDNVKTGKTINNGFHFDNNVPMSSGTWNNTSGQWWHIQPSGINVGANQPPLYFIISVATGVFLTASDQVTPNPVGNGDIFQVVGARGVLDGNQQPTYQAWTFTAQSDKPNSYIIGNSKQSGNVLDMDGGESKDGTPVITFPNNQADNQKWQLTKLYPHKK